LVATLSWIASKISVGDPLGLLAVDVGIGQGIG
jgi:hypothetical protein